MASVLIVEEDEVVRWLVRTILTNAGYVAREVANGPDGFRIARMRTVDAIVLDCLGRSGQGMETLIRLRTDQLTADIPVIAMCGLGQYGAELGLGAKAVDVKPFRPAQLLLKLHALIRARTASAYSYSPPSVLSRAI